MPLLPEAGDQIKGFRVLSELGRGGMGVVYEAQQLTLSRRVAFKVLAPNTIGNYESQLRFIREARLQAKLDHPNILPIFDAGRDGDLLYIAMKLVRGHDLANMLRVLTKFEPKRALELLTPVAAALDEAHRSRLVHRDLKPGNILVEEPSRTYALPHVYLSDFGLARSDDITEIIVSKPGAIMGTPAYMSPEQVVGKKVDSRTDVYALACVLFECLTGRLPYIGTNFQEIALGHIAGQLPELGPPLQSFNPVVRKGLAKDPQDRYPSCGALVEAAKVAQGAAAQQFHRESRPLPRQPRLGSPSDDALTKAKNEAQRPIVRWPWSIAVGDRVRLSSNEIFQPEMTGFPERIVSKRQTGVVLAEETSRHGTFYNVQWDAQEWTTFPIGFRRGRKVALKSFRCTVHRSWIGRV
jgi:serine/threonine protein kinase